MQTQGFRHISGAKEKGNFHYTLMNEMNQSANHCERAQQSHAQDNIGDLAHRGIGQPFLQILVMQGLQRSIEDGDGCRQ